MIKLYSLPYDDIHVLFHYFNVNNIPDLYQALVNAVDKGSMTPLLNDISKYGVLGKCVGSGTYGTVCLTDKDYVIKESDTDFEGSIRPSELREICVIDYLARPVPHPNIISFESVKIQNDAINMVMKKAINNLEKFKPGTKLGIPDINTRRNYMYQLMHGLAYMHSRNVIHRDLKSQNILVFENNNLKLADFGLARVMHEYIEYNAVDNTQKDIIMTGPDYIVTLWWRSPELLLGDYKYSYEVDVWSMGVIFLQMLVGRAKVPFFMSTKENVIYLILKYLGLPPPGSIEDKLSGFKKFHTPSNTFRSIAEHYATTAQGNFDDLLKGFDPVEIDLLRKMLTWKSQRISAYDALSHPYFVNINKTTFPKINNDKCAPAITQFPATIVVRNDALSDVVADDSIAQRIKDRKHKEKEQVEKSNTLNKNSFVRIILDVLDIIKKLSVKMTIKDNYFDILYSTLLLFYIVLGKKQTVTLRKQLMFVCLTCFNITLKLLYNPYEYLDLMSELSNINAAKEVVESYSVSDFIKMEYIIYATTNFELIFPTIYTYLRIYVDYTKLNDAARTNLELLGYFSLIEYSLATTYSQQDLALAAIYIYNKTNSKYQLVLKCPLIFNNEQNELIRAKMIELQNIIK